jgi:aspartate/methionine/tyrosine aminotransferase
MKIHPRLLAGQEYPLFVYKQKAQELRDSGVDVIDLTLGDPEGPTYELARQAAIDFLKNNASSSYPPPKGDAAYLKSFADWALRNHNVVLHPDTQIIATSGTKSGIYFLAHALDWSDQREIFIPSLSYPVYEASAKFLDIPLRLLPISQATGFFPDLDAIDEATWKKCQMFWLNSPHNPTSAIASKAYLQKLLTLAEKHDFLVCSDECYNEIYFQDPPASILDCEPSNHWVLFRSLSKRSHMTGYRCGIIASRHQPLIAALSKMRSPMGLATSSIIEAAGTAAWNDDTHPKNFAAHYATLQKQIVKALEDKGFTIFGGKATFYLWFSHPQLTTSQALVEYFLQGGIVLSPGTAFGPDGEGYARMVFCIDDATCTKLVSRIAQLPHVDRRP